jgi:hypothetical protein
MQDNGSLYDLLHNQTFAMEGDLALSILKDVVQVCDWVGECGSERVSE